MAEKRCFMCGRTNGLENHHIFGGSNRKHSTKYKLLVNLCAECHRHGKQAAHLNAETAQELHEYGQRKFMKENNATIADFVKIFGRNFLNEEW